MMARRSFAKNIIFIELEEILREEYFAWIYFNVEIILILFDIYIFKRKFDEEGRRDRDHRVSLTSSI